MIREKWILLKLKRKYGRESSIGSFVVNEVGENEWVGAYYKDRASAEAFVNFVKLQEWKKL